MNYAAFKALAQKPHGHVSTHWDESFPLWFASQEDLLEEIDTFSTVDDWLGDAGMESLAEDFAERFPQYTVLAMCDVEVAQEAFGGDFHFDSYAEFFLVVDTSQEACPVLRWSAEEGFVDCSESFEAFFASLKPLAAPAAD